MRELRFRHFDGKYMQYSDEFLSLADYFSFFKEFKKDELQYTGLYDKNGKPIFEGDIVFKDIGCDTINETHTVIFKDGCFIAEEQKGLGLCGIGVKFVLAAYIKEYEVIGNIYENPELLDKQT